MAPGIATWQTQMRKGLLELLVLSVIARSPAHGYAIATQLRDFDLFPVGEGTLYPLLARLTKRAVVEAAWDTSGSGPARKVYQITPLGRTELKSMRDFWSQLDRAVDGLGSDEK